ncbi:unnamed protein product, partial [Gongylonema pulchrum]|uniref:BPTI/Kunitz inhibitor domain-containing protein n=1 Tax=Gongylonema pulchrum TaxID=637853 RepID=A0A183EX14_9BILA
MNGGGACAYGTDPFEPDDGIYIADIYDCIAVPLNEPKREADTSAAVPTGVRPRWWFNAVTGTCEQFMWDPWDETEPQSPNNFKTREHCESYCRDTCKRGSPQYTESSQLIQDEQPVSNCQTMTSCQSNFECTSIGSAQLCCPTVASICSITGGRALDASSRSTSFDPGYPMKRMFGLNFETSGRYYYHQEQGRCMAFTYNGALGNYNNF